MLPAGRPAAVPESGPRQRAAEGRRFRHRAAERRRRPGRHLPRDGQQRDDVRHARLCARSPRRRHRLAGGAQAAGDPGGSRLLPALPVAGLGYQPGRPRPGGGGRGDRCGLRLAASVADHRRRRRLGGAPPRPASRRLGVPVRQSALSRRGRHRRGRHAAAPERRSRLRARRSTARANGSSACSPRMAAGARSSRRTRTTT